MYYGIILENADDIQHYGVKRRSGRYPWGSGERPFQSKEQFDAAMRGEDRTPLTKEHTIPKGTKMYRVTPNQNEQSSGYKYVTYLSPDRDYYKSTYIDDIKSNYGLGQSAKVYEKSYTLQKDLKIPSRDKLRSTQVQIINDSEKFRKIVDEKIFQDDPDLRNKKISDFSKDDIDTYKSYLYVYNDWLFKKSIPDMNHALNQLTTTKSFKNYIIDELSKEGYNAVIDENGVGGIESRTREGISPLIIFDGTILKEDNTHELEKYNREWIDANNNSYYTERERRKYQGNGKWGDYSDSVYI